MSVREKGRKRTPRIERERQRQRQTETERERERNIRPIIFHEMISTHFLLTLVLRETNSFFST
jgi:hypothetical protein